jgi:hypothetical protein
MIKIKIKGRNKEMNKFEIEPINMFTLLFLEETTLVNIDEFVQTELGIIKSNKLLWGKLFSYYTVDDNGKKQPVVATSGSYIRSKPNDTKSDNLSHLPITVI